MTWNAFSALGDLHLPDPDAGEDLAQGVLQLLLGREGHVDLQLPGIIDHGRIVQAEGPGRGELAETVLREAARELDLTLAADVVEDDRVALADPSSGFSRGVDQDQGVERFRVLASAVRFPHRRDRAFDVCVAWHPFRDIRHRRSAGRRPRKARRSCGAGTSYWNGPAGQRDLFGCKGEGEMIKIARKSGNLSLPAESAWEKTWKRY